MSVWDQSLGEDTLFYLRQAAKKIADQSDGRTFAVRVRNGIDDISESINKTCKQNKATYVDCIKCSDGFVLVFKFNQADEDIGVKID